MSAFDEDPGRTQVLPRVETPGGGQPPYAPPGTMQGMGGPPPKRNLTWLWIVLGVLGGLLLGAGVVWAVLRPAMTPVPVTPPVATSTVASETQPVPFTQAPPPAPPPTNPEQASDTKAPSTPVVTFPPSSYWLSPDNMNVEIKWNKVTDPSGVSYRLEFWDWLGGGASWGAGAVKVVTTKARYYDRHVTSFKERWRIIAIDGAGNESDPSEWYFFLQAASASEAESMNANFQP